MPGEPERFAVTAGGRRLKALQELAAEGAIAADCEVPCLVEAPDAALETSLMENTVRAAMHPADEFAAMAALIDGGATVEAVAARFGVSERHVRQRLKLGKLAPELLDAFRAGKLSLEVDHSLYARRRSSGAARGLGPAQGSALCLAASGAGVC